MTAITGAGNDTKGPAVWATVLRDSSMLSLILANLSCTELASCACTARAWRAVTYNPRLWRHLDLSDRAHKWSALLPLAQLHQLIKRAGAHLVSLSLDGRTMADDSVLALLLSLRPTGFRSLS